MMLLLLSILGCKPTPVEACVSFREALCTCGPCDGNTTPELQQDGCEHMEENGDLTEADVDYFTCLEDYILDNADACDQSAAARACADLQGGEE